MRKLPLILLICCVFPLRLWAAPSTVLSGEHEGYSRIVTPIRGAEWSITHEGRTVVLSFPGYDEGFDVSRIFDRIPRDKIKTIDASANTITLSLDCECAVSAVTERDLYVVIDVADAATDLVAPALPQGAAEPAQKAPKAKNAAPVPAVNFMSLALRPTSKPQVDLPDEIPLAVNQLQERLSVELNSALRRGILESTTHPKKTVLPENDDTSSAEQATPDADSSAAKQAEGQAEVDLNTANLRIRTSRDLPDTFRDLSEIVSERGNVCPPDATIALATWGDARPFADQISDARQGLYGEFDRIDKDVALKLAQTYLYFGFGAEARSVLLLNSELAKTASFLLAMAEIVDGNTLGQTNPFTGLAECQGETALWAVLAAPMPPEGALPSSNSALRALNSLPSHLRVILAPRVNEVLLAYGDPTGAATTLRSLERLPGELPPAAQLAQAKSKLTKGETAQGRMQLEKVVAENAAQSPLALITLVDAKVKADQPIDPETAQLIEAYVHELGETELGPELLEAHVIALVQSNQFDTAFEAAELAIQKSDTAKEAEIHQFMLAALTKSASDIVFLDHAFQQSKPELAALPEKNLMKFAQRLLDLGFAIDAEHALSVLPSPATNKEQKLLSAKVSLAMGKPLRAQANLIGLQDAEADQLRAKANQMSGAHDAAHQLYAQLDQPQLAQEAAWLSDDWRSLTNQDTPVFGATSALLDAAQPPEGTTGMLARTSNLLDQSAEARNTLRDLLNAEPLQLESGTE